MFHAGFQMFSGGFVGVDVFFVISGYLITTIILTEMEQGRFSLINFYERRARRILPALFLVMLASLPFAWFWLIPSNLVSFSQSLVGVSTFTSNIHFSHDTGYWATANELKPLLHTWSLAVEEQYYVFFPLYLILLWRFRKRWILSSFMVIAAISLMVAQLRVDDHPIETFFLLPTRLWELAIGAGIAFYFLYRKNTIYTLLSHKLIDELMCLAGLFMIAYAVFAFDETVPFPGIYALVPTAGTGLILLFSSSQTLVGRLLGTKMLVGIGLISYSAYLWHQPLFAFARNRILTEPSGQLYLALATLSIVLAYLSWRYVETPFRTKGIYSRKAIFTFAAAGTIFFILVGLIGEHNEGFQNRFKVAQSILDDFADHKLFDSCKNIPDSQGWVCALGSNKVDSDLSFAVFGDSHAIALLPAFDLAADSINKKYIFLGDVGCLPLLGADVAKGNHPIGFCERLATRQFEYVKEKKIRTVFLVARWSLFTDGGYHGLDKEHFLINKNSNKLTREASREVFVNALMNTIEEYRSIGVIVNIIEQVPEQKTDVKRLYDHISILNLTENEKDNVIENYSISRISSNKLQAFNRSVFETISPGGGVNVVNLDDYYCSSGICLIGDSNHSNYRDHDHLSTFAAELVANEILKLIE